MNKFVESVTMPLKWLMAILLATLLAGCGSGSGSAAVAVSSSKAITAYSLAWSTGTPGTATGTITGTSIAVTVPTGTARTALTATFTSTGTGPVTVGGVTQVSGAAPTNDFTTSKSYIVTAADGTTATYVVTVTVAASGPTAPTLGEAGRFVILAYAGVTGDAACAVSKGDMGITPSARTLMTGFTPSPNTSNPGGLVELTNGLSYAPEDSNTIAPSGYAIPYPYPSKYATVTIGTPWATTSAMLTQASSDETTAYNFLAADPNPGVATTPLVNPELGGQTLTAGVYKTASNLTITTGALNLNAQGNPNAVWIFSTDGTLTTVGPAPSGNITFVGGVGSAKNVYWRVAGATSIAANSTFIGNIFDQGTIAVLAGATVTGSLFSAAGSVTLISNTITKP